VKGSDTVFEQTGVYKDFRDMSGAVCEILSL